MHGAHYLLHLHTRTHKLVFPRPLEISCCTDKVWGSDRRHDFVVLPGLILQPPLAPISSQKRRLQNGAMKKECPPSFLLCPIRISCSLSCPLLHRSPPPHQVGARPVLPHIPSYQRSARLPPSRLGNVSIFVIAVKALQVRKGVLLPSGEQQCCDGACINSPQMDSQMTDHHLGVSATRLPRSVRQARSASDRCSTNYAELAAAAC